MLTEIYIEALLVDEELADQVWEAQGEIDDEVACIAWMLIVERPLSTPIILTSSHAECCTIENTPSSFLNL